MNVFKISLIHNKCQLALHQLNKYQYIPHYRNCNNSIRIYAKTWTWWIISKWITLISNLVITSSQATMLSNFLRSNTSNSTLTLWIHQALVFYLQYIIRIPIIKVAEVQSEIKKYNQWRKLEKISRLKGIRWLNLRVGIILKLMSRIHRQISWIYKVMDFRNHNAKKQILEQENSLERGMLTCQEWRH